jgi:hypothetical protein
MEYVRATTCNSSIEANITRAKLESEGVRCFLVNEHFSTPMPGMKGQLGSGTQAMVHYVNLENAKAILRSFEEVTEMCPECKSKNAGFKIVRNKPEKIFVPILSFPFTILINNIKGNHYCRDCGPILS